MDYLLRFVACFWIFLTFRPSIEILRRVFSQGLHIAWSWGDLLTLVMLAGGIGLLFLREWARWALLIGAGAYFVLKAGIPLSHGNFSQGVIKMALFYGIFVVILILPQARGATRK